MEVEAEDGKERRQGLWWRKPGGGSVTRVTTLLVVLASPCCQIVGSGIYLRVCLHEW